MDHHVRTPCGLEYGPPELGIPFRAPYSHKAIGVRLFIISAPSITGYDVELPALGHSHLIEILSILLALHVHAARDRGGDEERNAQHTARYCDARLFVHSVFSLFFCR